VSNERSHDLTVLDGTTLETIATIPVPGRARGVRVTPDGRHALVALSDDRPQTPGPNDAIAEVDLTTHRVVRRLSAGTDPEQFAITPDGKRIVAANEDAGNASVIDPASGKVIASLVVGTEPEGVTVSPDGRWVYVTAETSNTISVIDMRVEKVVATFLVDARPRSVAFSPDGRFAWATSEVGGTVARSTRGGTACSRACASARARRSRSASPSPPTRAGFTSRSAPATRWSSSTRRRCARSGECRSDAGHGASPCLPTAAWPTRRMASPTTSRWWTRARCG
jgi:YVTN family beta-propeller protein